MTFELVAIVTLSLAGLVAVFALFARKAKQKFKSKHPSMKLISSNPFGHGRELSELYKRELETRLETFEGAEAIYRERDTIARVRVQNIKLTEVGIGTDIEPLPSPGLTSPSGAWHFGAVWDLFSVTDWEWSASYPISISVYFDPDVIRQVTAVGANRGASESDLLHLMKLRKCLNEGSARARTKQSAKAADAPRSHFPASSRSTETALRAVAVAVVLAAAFAVWVWLGGRGPHQAKNENTVAQNNRPYKDHLIDFRYQAPVRGPEQNTNKSPVQIPRDRLTLSIYLPVGSEPGHYEVQILQEPGQPLAQAEDSAEFRDHIAVLTVKLDLTRLAPGLYLMEIRQSGLSWSQYPVLLK